MWSTGINRNIVECKDSLFIALDSPAAVLIETLWNVKISTAVRYSRDTGINRNIVECKDNTNSIKNNPYPVLIETLWNVKWILT